MLSIPIQAILVDNNLQIHIDNIDNPWVKWTLLQLLNSVLMTQSIHLIDWILDPRTG